MDPATLAQATTITFPTTAFPPLALGFFGLGTGYLIYGPQELLGFPRRSRGIDLTTGIWGVLAAGLRPAVPGSTESSQPRPCGGPLRESTGRSAQRDSGDAAEP